MYYYGNPYGYGNYGGTSCCGNTMPTCGGNTGYAGNGYAIVLVLFILLIIILGARNWN